MIRTVLTPEKHDISIKVPEKYIGKKVEVIVYTLEEIEGELLKPSVSKKPSEYAGSLTKEEGKELLEYVEKSRNEWNMDF